MLVEVHVLPQPAGTDSDPYAHVDAAITVVVESGLTYEVGALGTTLEGPADEVWLVLRSVHEAVMAAGADRNMTTIRLFDSAETQPSMTELVDPHRR